MGHEFLIVEDDHLGGITSLAERVGHDQCQWFPHKPDLVLGQHWPGRIRYGARIRGQKIDHHAVGDAGCFKTVGCVDAPHPLPVHRIRGVD